MLYLSLVQNIALLVSLTVIEGLLARRLQKTWTIHQLLSGILYGSVSVIGMMTPVNFAPGVIFDGRSIVICVAGLFGGPVTGIVAALIAGIYRMGLGGGGALMGVSVITASACVGIFWHYLRQRYPQFMRPVWLYLFGLLVHVIMVALISTLPKEVAGEVFKQIALPVLLVYPPATFLVCLLFVEMESRNNAEKALHESSIRYRELFNNMSNGVAVYEPINEGMDFIIKDINPSGTRKEGLSREEIIGKNVLEIFPDVKPLGLFEVFQRVWQTGESEYWPLLRSEDERIVKWVDNWVCKLPSGEIVSIYDDVSDKKQLEENQREQLRFLETLLETLPNPVFWKDKQGRYLGCNRSFEEFTGYSRSEFIEKTNWGRPPHGTTEKDIQSDKQLFSEPGKQSYEKEILSKDGIKREVIINKSTFTNSRGEVTGLIGVLSDITERKKAEMETQQLNQELEIRVQRRTALLEAANKELETFAYSVSHDLRAPLRAIHGFAEIIARRYRDDLNEEGRHYFDNILNAGMQMSHLIDDLLRYSRLGRKAVKQEQVDLQDLLSKILNHFQARIDENHVDLQIQSHLPVIPGDGTLLNVIFTNLIDNALTYFREGVPPKIEIGSKFEEDSIILFVADNGIGVDPKYHEKIFEIFQRLHSQSKYPGTGIGLGLVARSAALLGGRAWIESVPEQGSTFYVSLPYFNANQMDGQYIEE